MEMEALVLGRLTRSTVRTVDVQTTTTQLLAADPSRISFVIFPPLTNRFTLFPRGPAVLDTGFSFYPAGHPFTFHLAWHGEVVTWNWNAIIAVLHQDIVVVETTLVI